MRRATESISDPPRLLVSTHSLSKAQPKGPNPISRYVAPPYSVHSYTISFALSRSVYAHEVMTDGNRCIVLRSERSFTPISSQRPPSPSQNCPASMQQRRNHPDSVNWKADSSSAPSNSVAVDRQSSHHRPQVDVLMMLDVIDCSRRRIRR